MQKILVCLGSRNKGPTIHAQDVRAVTRLMVEAGFRDFIYGGGDKGLMGIFAQECKTLGANLAAIAPIAFANKEEAHDDTKTVIVNDLFERKSQMIHNADALLVLYGGIGTWDELAEGAADNDIRRVGAPESALKPIFVLNRDGFWDPTFAQLERMLLDGYVHPKQLDMVRVARTPEEMVGLMKHFQKKGIRPASVLNNTVATQDYVPRWKRTLDEQYLV